MKKTSELLMLVLLLFSFFACKEDGGDDDQLEVSTSVMRFEGEGTKQELTVSSNVALSAIQIKCDADWLITEPLPGGNGFWVTVQENTTGSVRSTFLQVCAGNQIREVDVVQGMNKLLEFTAESGKCWDLNTQLAFGVKTRKAWTATPRGGWFKLDKTEGLGNDVIKITFDKNTSVSERYGEVVVKVQGAEEVFTFTQSGALEDLGRVGDSLALVAIYKTMHGDEEWGGYGGTLAPWLKGAPINKWAGVECNEQGRVRLLTFSVLNQAYGEAFPEEIKYLTELDYFLFNPAPTYDSGVKPDVHYTGTIPFEFARCTKMKALIFVNCEFTDTEVPAWLGCFSELEELRFETDNNQAPLTLKGGLPWELTACSKMFTMAYDYCGLDGELPEIYGHFFPRLQFLVLPGNKFEGTVPESWGKLQLTTLDLTGNSQLSGRLPSAMCDRFLSGEMYHLRIDKTSLVECDAE